MSKILIVVDYQNDFVDGALGFKGAEKIEKEIIRLVKKFKEDNETVVFTKDTHYPNYMDTIEGKNLPVPHCIKDTHGHQITPNLDKLVGHSLVFEKETFPSLDLGNYLKEQSPSEIYLCGLVSDICVFSNAIIAKASCPNSEVYLIKNASDSYDKDMESKSYDVLRHLHINVVEL